MDIRQIRAFLAIADAGSVTRAAEVLHIVQPAVSRQLKLLEEDVGASLFERGRHGMALTEAGRLLLERARRALHELEAARLEIRPVPGSVSGLVNLGLLPSSCELLVGPLVGALQRRYPKIRVSLSVGYTDPMRRWLESGELDLALLYDMPGSPALDVEPLVEEGLCLAGLAGQHLDSDVPVGVAALGSRPLVLPSPPHGLRSLTEHACAIAGVTLTVAAETNALSVQKSLVAQGYGLSVLPRVAIATELARGLLAAPRIADPAFVRNIVIALPTTRRTSVAVRCVGAELKACMHEIVANGQWLDARWLGPTKPFGDSSLAG